MDWLELFKTLGVSGIIVSGIVLLVKKITEQFFAKDLEKFKSDLEKEAIEFKIRYEGLHGERIEIIKEVYKKIATTYESFRSLINPWQPATDPSQEEKGKKAANDANSLISFYEQNRIFFDEKLAEEIDRLLSSFKDAWGKFNASRISKDMKDHSTAFDQWRQAWKQIEQETPKIKRQLENRFRDVLGIENKK